jgi:hypothetical protein
MFFWGSVDIFIRGDGVDLWNYVFILRGFIERTVTDKTVKSYRPESEERIKTR